MTDDEYCPTCGRAPGAPVVPDERNLGFPPAYDPIVAEAPSDTPEEQAARSEVWQHEQRKKIIDRLSKE